MVTVKILSFWAQGAKTRFCTTNTNVKKILRLIVADFFGKIKNNRFIFQTGN